MAILIERIADHATHLVLRQTFGQRIERQKPHLWIVVCAVKPCHARMRHLPAAPSMPRLGRQEHVLPLAKLLAHKRLIKPKRPQEFIPLLYQNTDDALAEAAASTVDFDDFAADCLHVVFVELADLAMVGKILVVAREKEYEIARRANVELRQKPCPLRSDTSHEFDWRRQKLRRRGLPACWLVLGRRQ